MSHSDRLSIGSKSAFTMLNLGLSARGRRMPMHLDGIDVFITPFLRKAAFLHDYHVPMIPELVWLGHYPLAAVARTMLPYSLRNAKVVIAPNSRMLAHATGYARLPESYIIPNYPLKSFYVKISAEAARERLQLPQEQQIALFVGGGRIREIYGFDLLVETWIEIRKKEPDATLYILGPNRQLGMNSDTLQSLGKKGIEFPGIIPHSQIPIWISAADLCVSQRTPGFPDQFYNIHDSIKLSEYALFEKPIVTAGYLPCSDYLSSDTTIESFSAAILDGLRGKAPKPKPHTWEENIPTIRKAYGSLADQAHSSEFNE
ncbi:MAG: glycosyltransferase [Candidatus Thorarchaeota archaeon]